MYTHKNQDDATKDIKYFRFTKKCMYIKHPVSKYRFVQEALANLASRYKSLFHNGNC